MGVTLVSTKIRCEKTRWNGTRIIATKKESNLQKLNKKLSKTEAFIDEFFTELIKKKLTWREAAQHINNEIKPFINPKAKSKATDEEKEAGTIPFLTDLFHEAKTVKKGTSNGKKNKRLRLFFLPCQ